MSEKQPNYEDRLLKVKSPSGTHDVYAEHVTVFAYAAPNHVYDNLYIRHPDNENGMYYWRYATDTGKEVEDYDRVKWRAIQLGSKALLNLGEDVECLTSDRDIYIKHSTTDIDEEFKFDTEE